MKDPSFSPQAHYQSLKLTLVIVKYYRDVVLGFTEGFTPS